MKLTTRILDFSLTAMRRFLYLTAVFLLLLAAFTAARAQGYFQQEVNYTIHVRLNDSLHELNAAETIRYVNHAPVALSEIYFHLWTNAYRDNSTAFAKQEMENGNTRFYYAPASERGCVDQYAFRVDGQPAVFIPDAKNPDIGRLVLDRPLKPGQEAVITTPFHVKIPDSDFSRLGHKGQGYYITQWYPKPAVYDINGWNAMPYMNLGEFYSEFGQFDVYITLPSNYVVGATGDLVDGDEEEKWLDAKAAETAKTSTFSRDLSFPPSSKSTKTLHYHQENVHDFAWFADKRYHVMQETVEIPGSGQKVTARAFFTNEDAKLWLKATSYLREALTCYSELVGPYPYRQITAVQGELSAGTGMEYPNITVIGHTGSDRELEEVTVHEAGHNWFYGILGSNERAHPWMDEGINSYFTARCLDRKQAGKPREESLLKMMETGAITTQDLIYPAYLFQIRHHFEQPSSLRSEEFSFINYGISLYFKPVLAFDSLQACLGDELFDRCIRNYYETWKFRHPGPGDLRDILENTSGKKLDWFFDGLIGSTGHLDYTIDKAQSRGGHNPGLNLDVRNRGTIAGPFPISASGPGSADTALWFEGFTGKKNLFFPGQGYRELAIDKDLRLPEADRRNNRYHLSALFPKFRPVKPQILLDLENPRYSQVFFFPVMGWNNYDKFMAGLAVYNNPVFRRLFEYVAVPMYAAGSGKLTGYFSGFLNLYPRSDLVKTLRIGVGLAGFDTKEHGKLLRYNKTAPQVELGFRNHSARSTVRKTLKIRFVQILKENPRYDKADSVWRTDRDNYGITEVAFHYANKRTIHPYEGLASMEAGTGMMKLSFTGKYKMNYNKPRKYLDMRFFFGCFVSRPGNGGQDYRLRLSGSSGRQDYLYDEVFMGRAETGGLLSQQFVDNDGAFKLNTTLGQTWDWLTAVNLKTDLPWKIPVKLFADIGTFEGARNATSYSRPFQFDGGVEICLADGVCEVFFPLFMSEDLKKLSDFDQKNYGEKIRFTLNLSRINPFELFRKLVY